MLHDGMNSFLLRTILEGVENAFQHKYAVVELGGVGNGNLNLTNSFRPIVREINLPRKYPREHNTSAIVSTAKPRRLRTEESFTPQIVYISM